MFYRGVWSTGRICSEQPSQARPRTVTKFPHEAEKGMAYALQTFPKRSIFSPFQTSPAAQDYNSLLANRPDNYPRYIWSDKLTPRRS